MVANHIRLYCVVPLLCAVAATRLAAEQPRAEPNDSNQTVNVKIVESDDTRLVVELTITSANECGVPNPDKIPYVSRLFQNTGVGRVTRTIVIPKCPSAPISEVITKGGVAASKVEHIDEVADGQTLPSADYLKDDVTYFPAGSTIKPSGDFCPQTCPAQKEVRTAACDSKSNKKRHTKTKFKCGDGRCVSCACCNRKDVANELRERLLSALVENAELRVLAEAQAEIAAIKLEATHELNAVRQEFADYRAQAIPFQNVRMQPVASPVVGQPVVQSVPKPAGEHQPQVAEQLQVENVALKRRIAELERQLKIVH